MHRSLDHRPMMRSRRDRVRTLCAVLVCSAVAACSSGGDLPNVAEVDRLVNEAESGRIRSGDRVRVTGIVTDDDAERELAFIGDGSRAIAVYTGRGGLRVARGRKVTIEARVEITGWIARLAEPLILDSQDGALPDAIAVDAGEMFDGRHIGRRVELASRVQAATMKDDRLQLTVTSHGVQLDAEVRRPNRDNWRELVGADVRLRGIMVPADPRRGIPEPGRLVIASLTDVQLVRAVSNENQLLKVLTTAASVQALSPEDASMAHPVNLVARVTFNDPTWAVFFAQDETAGIFVFTRTLLHATPDCRAGDLVEIVGETGPGEFAPTIVAHHITVKGRAPLPPARPVALDQLLSGREDSQFVEMTGIVRSVTRDAENHLALDLVHARERISAFVPSIHGQVLPDGLGIDAVVRVKAVAGARFNARRQMVGAQLWIPSAREIEVTSPAPADPFELPERTVDRLLDFAGANRAGRIAKIRGVVLLSRDQVVYVRDDSGTVEIHAAENPLVLPGDVVEVAGFPSATDYSPLMEDALVRRVGRSALPPAVRGQPLDLLRSGTSPELVKIEARLVEQIATPSEDVLLLDSGGTSFSAHLDRGSTNSRIEALPNGSVIELTGIPSVQAVRQANRLVPRDLRLMLVSASSVRVVRAPFSVSGSMLLWMAGGVVLLIALGIGGRTLLRTMPRVSGRPAASLAVASYEARSRDAR